MSTPMIVYADRVAIGEIRDFGPGRVLAVDFIESGRVSLGFFATRRDAMAAIAARHPKTTRDAA